MHKYRCRVAGLAGWLPARFRSLRAHVSSEMACESHCELPERLGVPTCLYLVMASHSHLASRQHTFEFVCVCVFSV